jgi:hypothetical protein
MNRCRKKKPGFFEKPGFLMSNSACDQRKTLRAMAAAKSKSKVMLA